MFSMPVIATTKPCRPLHTSIKGKKEITIIPYNYKLFLRSDNTFTLETTLYQNKKKLLKSTPIRE